MVAAENYAGETGWRAIELRAVQAGDFDIGDLDAAPVRLQEADSKNRQGDMKPLKPATARVLAKMLQTMHPSARVFPTASGKEAKMLETDLKAAEIPYELEPRGDLRRFHDFHALRPTFFEQPPRDRGEREIDADARPAL